MTSREEKIAAAKAKRDAFNASNRGEDPDAPGGSRGPRVVLGPPSPGLRARAETDEERMTRQAREDEDERRYVDRETRRERARIQAFALELRESVGWVVEANAAKDAKADAAADARNELFCKSIDGVAMALTKIGEALEVVGDRLADKIENKKTKG